MYQPCHAPLVWVKPQPYPTAALQPGAASSLYEPPGYWRCARAPECGWRYYPHPRLRDAVLSLEVVGDGVFKVGAVRCTCVFVYGVPMRIWGAPRRFVM